MKKDDPKGRRITRLQNEIFGAMLIITILTTILTTSISIAVNLRLERDNLDNNLQNIAYTVAHSVTVREGIAEDGSYELSEYLDSMKSSIENVDVISIISKDKVRLYHTNKELVGTLYDGTLPDFEKMGELYVTSDTGPSGSQRRVYTALHDNDGNYIGFALIVLLNQHFQQYVISTVLIHGIVAILIIAIAVVISNRISRRIKHKLWGYEPDAFSAMYSVRDNVLESLAEGVIAFDYDERILFMNKAARTICNVSEDYSNSIKDYPMLSKKDLKSVLKSGERLVGISIKDVNVDAVANYYPVIENNQLIGAICVLLDRTEYTKIAEDLSGVKFLVESMRANNHDFTNKLHVILGLIQMGANKEAAEYIGNITSIQKELISSIMRNIEDPSLAALLIGKYSKASELNVSFSLETGSKYKRNDVDFNSSDLITIVGNLVENAFEAMNQPGVDLKELTVGIFTSPGAMIIRVDDTGMGIPENFREKVFETGITTKGENHGTGLFLVRQIVERYSGTIDFESEEGVGTSFTVSLLNDNGGNRDV